MPPVAANALALLVMHARDFGRASVFQNFQRNRSTLYERCSYFEAFPFTYCDDVFAFELFGNIMPRQVREDDVIFLNFVLVTGDLDDCVHSKTPRRHDFWPQSAGQARTWVFPDPGGCPPSGGPGALAETACLDTVLRAT